MPSRKFKLLKEDVHTSLYFLSRPASSLAQDEDFRYDIEDFVRAPNICTKISTIANCHQRLDILIDKREAQGLIGQAVFRAAVSCEGNAHGNKKSNHIKQEN